MLKDKVQKVVVAAVLLHDKKILLARRSPRKKLAPGKYHLPGGHVEYGEHPSDALKREILEELGIRVTVKEPLYIFDYTLQEKHTIGIAYNVDIQDPLESIRWDQRDIDTVVWVTAETLHLYLHPDDYNSQIALLAMNKLN